MELFFNIFSGFRWQDALDIFVNAYILFRFYVLFRGTNVFRGLIIVFILWGISQLALALGLIITNYIMQGVIAVAALIVIVAFRNEISGVLKTKNLKSFLWDIPRNQFKTPVNIIVESVAELARKKIGALIVLPGKQGLDSALQGGVDLDCRLSKEMLVSLFWPDSPMHDGAAIIEKDKIVSAGVILPLSINESLPSFFGTRHRAASGLAEQTDAVIIVVSEERGKITLFDKDNYTTADNINDLERMLHKRIDEAPAETGFKNKTLELTAVGLISIAFTTGIWAAFSKGMESLAEHEVPIEFVSSDQKMEIVSSSASSIKLLVSGASPLIKSLRPEQLHVKLNLAKAAVGDNKLIINQNNIHLPPGIHLKQVQPSEIEIRLDTLIEKEIPIQPYWVGKLPQGLAMEKAEPVPETIKIIGADIALKDISTVFTEELLLDNIKESGTIKAELVLNSPSIKFKDNQKVQIKCTVYKKSLN